MARQLWTCRECGQQWRGTEAVSGTCPTCHSSFVERGSERARTIKIVISALLGGILLVIEIIHRLYPSLVEEALYWWADHRR